MHDNSVGGTILRTLRRAAQLPCHKLKVHVCVGRVRVPPSPQKRSVPERPGAAAQRSIRPLSRVLINARVETSITAEVWADVAEICVAEVFCACVRTRPARLFLFGPLTP